MRNFYAIFRVGLKSREILFTLKNCSFKCEWKNVRFQLHRVPKIQTLYAAYDRNRVDKKRARKMFKIDFCL